MQVLKRERKQETQLSPRDPCDALYQLKCCSTVVRITQTDSLLARGAFSATATFCYATYIVLYKHLSTIAQRAWDALAVISRLTYKCTTESNIY